MTPIYQLTGVVVPVSVNPEVTRIDWVAPPFAGHLFPMLEIARGLREAGWGQQRFLTTPRMRKLVEGAGFPFQPVMAEREEQVFRAANGDQRVGINPLALTGQLKRTVGFLVELREELLHRWEAQAPHLAIVDSLLPSAGWAARRSGARWWTSLASPCQLETRTGTPGYFGGWTPGPGLRHALRDRAGRSATRAFKRAAGWLVRRELREMGVRAIYRADGTEACYSDDTILALGHPALEFERDWPDAMEFVGYPAGSPLAGPPPPAVDPGAPSVLVTLGTHLAWAKAQALERARELASRLPDWTVHVSLGDPTATRVETDANLSVSSYVPYGDNLQRYRAIVHHAGSGITYTALTAGVPSLLWPHDHDQFDNAARVIAQGAALRTDGSAKDMAQKLTTLDSDSHIKTAATTLQRKLTSLHPATEVNRLLQAENSTVRNQD